MLSMTTCPAKNCVEQQLVMKMYLFGFGEFCLLCVGVFSVSLVFFVLFVLFAFFSFCWRE